MSNLTDSKYEELVGKLSGKPYERTVNQNVRVISGLSTAERFEALETLLSNGHAKEIFPEILCFGSESPSTAAFTLSLSKLLKVHDEYVSGLLLSALSSSQAKTQQFACRVIGESPAVHQKILTRVRAKLKELSEESPAAETKRFAAQALKSL